MRWRYVLRGFRVGNSHLKFSCNREDIKQRNSIQRFYRISRYSKAWNRVCIESKHRKHSIHNDTMNWSNKSKLIQNGIKAKYSKPIQVHCYINKSTRTRGSRFCCSVRNKLGRNMRNIIRPDRSTKRTRPKT